jgi:hypothetical protein
MRQEHKAFFGLRQSHHFQLPMVSLGSLGRLRTGISLSYKRDFDRVARHGLDVRSQLLHLTAVWRIGRSDVQRQQVAKGSTARWTFEPRRRLAP